MKLSIKQKSKKEFFNETSYCGIGVLTLFYCIAFFGGIFIFANESLPFNGFILRALIYCIIVFLPWIIYNIIKKVGLNRSLFEIQQSLELFMYYKRFESYEEFEKILFSKSEILDFTGFKMFCKDDLYNPQHYIKKSIYAVHINKIIENYLDYFNINKKDDKVIKTLSLLELDDTNLKKVKEIFIEDRTNAFINYFLYQDSFISIEETLKKIEQYSSVYKTEKTEAKNLVFNSYTFEDIEKTIKENVKAASFNWIIPAMNIFMLALISIVYFCPDIAKEQTNVISYILYIFIIAIFVTPLFFVIKIVIKSLKNEKKFFEIAKYLPITKEEFTNLNITKYNEVEDFVFNLFYNKIALPQYRLEETIATTLEKYLIEHVETDEIVKTLFENSFTVYYNNEENNKPKYFDLIDEFVDRRTKELIKILEDKKSTSIEKTFNEVLIYGKAHKAEYNVYQENGDVTIVKFTIGDVV